MSMARLPLPAVVISLLAASSTSVGAQPDGEASAALDLITTTVRPGVELVLADDAGHDLTRRYPNNHRDMDLIAIGPDGTVWIASSASGADNEFFEGQEVWAVGRPGVTTLAGENLHALMVQPDGTPITVTAAGIFVLEGDDWVADPGTRQWDTPDGTIWLIEQDDPAGDDVDVVYDGFGVLVARWDGESWSSPGEWGETIDDPDVGQWRIDPDGGIAGLVDGVSFGLLEGTFIKSIALAPDGMVWAIGGIGDENGGVYRIDPKLASEPAPTDETSIA